MRRQDRELHPAGPRVMSGVAGDWSMGTARMAVTMMARKVAKMGKYILAVRLGCCGVSSSKVIRCRVCYGCLCEYEKKCGERAKSLVGAAGDFIYKR